MGILLVMPLRSDILDTVLHCRRQLPTEASKGYTSTVHERGARSPSSFFRGEFFSGLGRSRKDIRYENDPSGQFSRVGVPSRYLETARLEQLTPYVLLSTVAEGNPPRWILDRRCIVLSPFASGGSPG